jgi:hypothetical protein
VGGAVSAAGVLPILREAFSHLPDWCGFSPRQLSVLMFLHGYTDEPVEDFDIAAATPRSRLRTWRGRREPYEKTTPCSFTPWPPFSAGISVIGVISGIALCASDAMDQAGGERL